MTTQPGTEVAIRAPVVEKLPAPETVLVPAALLLAAESVTMGGDGGTPIRHGVFLHAKDKRGRVIATDGERMFIASFAVEGKLPSWLSRGVLVSREGLKARVGMIAKGVEEAQAQLTHTKGTQRVQLADPGEDMVFQLEVIEATYPDYDALLASESFVDLDGEGRARGHDWKPVGISSKYLKHCGEIAKTLTAGLPKEAREKNGMVVRSFHGAEDRPLVFDFVDWPGAVLLVMPAKLASSGFAKETAALLAPAVRGSIAALRAHATRQLMRAQEAKSDAEKADAMAKAKEFQDRVSALMDRAPGIPQLKQQPKQPQPEPETPPQETESEAPSGEVGGPKITRKRVKVPA